MLLYCQCEQEQCMSKSGILTGVSKPSFHSQFCTVSNYSAVLLLHVVLFSLHSIAVQLSPHTTYGKCLGHVGGTF